MKKEVQEMIGVTDDDRWYGVEPEVNDLPLGTHAQPHDATCERCCTDQEESLLATQAHIPTRKAMSRGEKRGRAATSCGNATQRKQIPKAKSRGERRGRAPTP